MEIPVGNSAQRRNFPYASQRRSLIACRIAKTRGARGQNPCLKQSRSSAPPPWLRPGVVLATARSGTAARAAVRLCDHAPRAAADIGHFGSARIRGAGEGRAGEHPFARSFARAEIVLAALRIPGAAAGWCFGSGRTEARARG